MKLALAHVFRVTRWHQAINMLSAAVAQHPAFCGRKGAAALRLMDIAFVFIFVFLLGGFRYRKLFLRVFAMPKCDCSAGSDDCACSRSTNAGGYLHETWSVAAISIALRLALTFQTPKYSTSLYYLLWKKGR